MGILVNGDWWGIMGSWRVLVEAQNSVPSTIFFEITDRFLFCQFNRQC